MSSEKTGAKRPAVATAEGSQALDTTAKKLRRMADEMDRVPTESTKLAAEISTLRADNSNLRTKLETKSQQVDKLELKLSRIKGMLAEQELTSYKLYAKLRVETQSQDDPERAMILQQSQYLEIKEMIQKLQEEFKGVTRRIRVMESDMEYRDDRLNDMEMRLEEAEDPFEVVDKTFDDHAARLSAVEDRLPPVGQEWRLSTQ